MDVIIRNDLFSSYTNLIMRLLRKNRRTLCVLALDPEDVFQDLSLAVLCALDDYDEQCDTPRDAYVWMRLQCAFADLKRTASRCAEPEQNDAVCLADLISNDRLWKALSRLNPTERACVIQYLDDQAAPSPDFKHCLDSAMEKLRSYYLTSHAVHFC